MPPNNDALPPAPQPIDHVQRWAAIVERRRAQMEAAYAASGMVNVDYWGKRAKNYRAALHEGTESDPFLIRVLKSVMAESTVLDVGAGTGRHTVALAPRVGHVTAVEPSAAMLEFLRQDLDEQELTNVATVPAEWLAADVESADIVICSHVLYPIADVVPFVEKLTRAARERVFVSLRVDPVATDFGLWSEFYGVPLQSQPTYIDLLNVLVQIGVHPDVEVAEHRFTWTFANIDEAVAQIRNTLCLRDDDAAATEKLRALLESRLEPWPDGRLGPSLEHARVAIISWAPDRGEA